MEEITITITLKKTHGKNSGTVRLKHGSCIANATSDNGTKISVGGTIGAGYEITVGENTYYASPTEIWNAAAPLFGLEKADN